MKLTLSGPQALTLFPVTKESSVPAAAKASSFATPQGYVCADTGKLHIFIKGREYCFLDYEMHETELASLKQGQREVPPSEGEENNVVTYDTMNMRVNNLESDVAELRKHVDNVVTTIYSPLCEAFKALHDSETHEEEA